MDQLAPDKLITTYLHMNAPSDFQPAFLSEDDLADVTLMPMRGVDVAYYRFIYRSVGEVWHWRDRLIMPEYELAAALAQPGTSVHVLYVDGVPAGFFELSGTDGNVELVYFGLRAAFIGRGLGKHLLSLAIQQAWDDGATRLWVHTCNLDAPQAIDNYRKRGFQVYDVREEPMPEHYE